MKYTNDETQHVVAIVGRICYIPQTRSKKVCSSLSYAGCLTVHVLSVLCPRNCLFLTLNAYVRVFGPCFNILLNSPIPYAKLILLLSELIFSSTCPQCSTAVTWTTRAWPVFCISAGTVLSLHMVFPGFQK